MDEQADGQPRKSQIGDNLRFVNREQTLDRFELERDALCDDHIEPIPAVKVHPLVAYCKRSLPHELEPSFGNSAHTQAS